MKVFLGGTCAGSKWRDNIIPQLKCEYFNPVVDDWTPEHRRLRNGEKGFVNIISMSSHQRCRVYSLLQRQ